MDNNRKFQFEIKTLKNISSLLGDLYMEDIEALEEMIATNTFKIAVIGGFSVGKTTFLNALLGKRLLYSSAKEATGTVTYIKNSNKKIGIVEYEDKSIVQVDLNMDNSYEILKEYLNKNSIKKAKSVEIHHPIDGINKDVVFVDTPGLEGVSKEEMQITKSLIKEANAVIFMIKHNGLVKNDLEILTGRLKEFGKIQTKEIFVVINKIGELYDIRANEEIEKSIQKIINDVREHLKDNGLDNIKIFALDSKDYLWGMDNKLYKLLQSKENINKILSQEEYLSRGKRFVDYKENLKEFLEDENREKAFIDNVNERLISFIEIFDEELESKKNIYSENINEKINSLQNQKVLILENRRKIFNKIKRQLSESKYNFIDALYIDEIEKNKKENRNILEYIQANFNNIEKLDNKNKEDMIKSIEKMIDEDKEDSINKINKFYRSLVNIIGNIFNMEFNKILKDSVDFKFNLTPDKIKINLIFKDVEEKNDSIKELQDEKDEKKNLIIKLEKEIAQLEKENNENEVIRIQFEINKIEIDIKKKIDLLGRRPEPEQKYRTETRSRRKWIFFKDYYDVQVPDGLDYSKCGKWDNDKQKIVLDGENKKNTLYEIINKTKSKINNIKSLKNQIKREKEELESISKSLNEVQKKQKQLIENNKKLFLERKKGDLAFLCEQILKINKKDLKECFVRIIDENYNSINYKIQEQAKDFIEILEKKLEDKISELKEKLNNVTVEEGQAIKNFKTLKNEMVG